MGLLHDLDAYEGLIFDAIDLGLKFGCLEGGEAGDLGLAVEGCCGCHW